MNKDGRADQWFTRRLSSDLLCLNKGHLGVGELVGILARSQRNRQAP